MSVVLQDVGSINRRTYLGGSDIAGILGISPWSSRVSVYQRKVDPPTEDEQRSKVKRFNRGKLWEQVVGEMLVSKLRARDYTVEIVSANHRYIDPDIPYFAAEIDYEIKLDDIPGTVNVELKTVHPNATKEWGDEDTDECPVWYAAQAMWGLGITRRKCCIVAPLFGADEIRVYPIVAEAETIDGMRSQAQLFWTQHVELKVPPLPQSLADVDRLFKVDADKKIIAEPWVIEKLMRYRACEAEITAREAERDLLEFETKRFMGEANALHVWRQEAPAATWKNRANARFNTEAFKEAYPKLYQQFLRKGSSRVFEVKKFKPEV